MMFTRWAHIDRPTWRATKHSLLISYIFFCCVWMPRKIDSYRPISDTAMKDVWGRLSPRCQLYAHKTYTTGRGRGRKGVDCQCPTHWRLFLSLYTLLSCWLYRLMISTVPLYPISHSYVSRVVRSSIEMVGTIDHVPVDCPSYKGGKEKKKQIEVTSQKKKKFNHKKSPWNDDRCWNCSKLFFRFIRHFLFCLVIYIFSARTKLIIITVTSRNCVYLCCISLWRTRNRSIT